ncbi:MAG: STAS domain-containing protein [Chitinophagaceae bacterium]|nr:STAS domain-containing protein [Chitinophagaceae bacterium]
MQVKVDTKEKFTTITPLEPNIYASMAVELNNKCKGFLQHDVRNMVLNLQSVDTVDDDTADTIAKLQQTFYDANASFVICEIKPLVEETFEKLELLEYLNVTPTESEAWDIIQMEEIERELLDTDDIEFNKND